MFGTGAAIDYGRAAQIRTKLNAAADAAALAALTPTMLQQSATRQRKPPPRSCSTGQTSGVTGLSSNLDQVTVTITTGANNALIRTVTVSYNADHVNTIFARSARRAQCP